MNHLVFLDTLAGELEKILSGVKTMLIKKYDPAQTSVHPISPGDSLYFLRDKDECALRVKATIIRVLFFTNHPDENLSQILKEVQPKLQLTEDQYNHWSAQEQAALIEFDAAQKIPMIKIAPEKFKDRSAWIAFEELSLIT
jgi:hypothetical protein